MVPQRPTRDDRRIGDLTVGEYTQLAERLIQSLWDAISQKPQRLQASLPTNYGFPPSTALPVARLLGPVVIPPGGSSVLDAVQVPLAHVGVVSAVIVSVRAPGTFEPPGDATLLTLLRPGAQVGRGFENIPVSMWGEMVRARFTPIVLRGSEVLQVRLDVDPGFPSPVNARILVHGFTYAVQNTSAPPGKTELCQW